MKLKIKKLHPDAIVPKYATDGAACFDLHSIHEDLVRAGRAETFNTGIAFEVPEGYAMMIYSRSGHGFKSGVRLGNCVGVLDSDFRGVAAVRIQNDGDIDMFIAAGDRIAQAMLIPVEQVEFDLVEELSSTERGAGGFGSTGK